MSGEESFSEDEDLDTLIEKNADREEDDGTVDDPDVEEAVVRNSDENVSAGPRPNQEANGTVDGDDESKKKELPKKKIVRNPQPKLNADRICGKQGIRLLPKVFAETKFSGKGHETSDLNKLMGALEHWAHRLFPQLQFDNVLDRIERLGSKKPVQVYVKKMRMDMLVEEDDAPIVDSSDDEAGRNQEATSQVASARNNDDLFEELLREPPFNRTTSFAEKASTSLQPTASPQATSHASPLSEELLQKIERNRQLALERKRARESLLTASASDSPVDRVPVT